MKIFKYSAAFTAVLLGLAMMPLANGAQMNSAVVLVAASSVGGSIWKNGLDVSAEIVDGKRGKYRYRKGLEVPTGQHVIGLRIRFDVGYSHFGDVVNFRGNFVSGHNYVARGRQNNGDVDVWIEDTQTQELASKVLSIKAQNCVPFNCPKPSLSVKSEL